MNEDERNQLRADEAKGERLTPEEVTDLISYPYEPDGVVKIIGIGTGDSGQYLERLQSGKYRIVDERAHIIIHLANPIGLLHGLQRQMDIGEL